MLNTLDILIAFAVIMTVLSLIITILVQMVSAALSLRGKNLANALSLTFQTIDPHIGEKAHSLAAQILRDPIFSDSIMRLKKRVVPLVNAATQIIIDAERIVKKAEQTLKAAERALAENREASKKKALEDAVEVEKAALKKAQSDLRAIQPAVTPTPQKPVSFWSRLFGLARQPGEVKPNREKPWSFWSLPFGSATHLGSAIRPGEIYRILHEFGNLTETEARLRDIPPKLVETATQLIEELRKTDQPALESQRKLQVVNWVSEFFKDSSQKKAVVDSLGNFGATVERATTQAYDRFQRWFGSGQDRAEQWFQTHVRMVTIVMAIVTAFLLQLDTIQIFRQLRDQPKLVEALVKSAPDVLKEGEAVLDPAKTADYYTYLLWLQEHPLFSLKAFPAAGEKGSYRRALAERLKTAPDPDYPLQQFDSLFDDAQKVEGLSGNSENAAAKPAYNAWIKQFPKYKLEPEPDFATITKDSIHLAIQQKIASDADGKNPPSSDTANKWLTEYDNLKNSGTMAFERAKDTNFKNLKKELDDAGFNLAPPSFLGRWDNEKLPPWASQGHPLFAHFLVHFLGVMMTAGLLALGAPFWFNLLKNLMSLRPAVASLIEKRPTSAPALPTAPATPPSPS
jgi:hypothetical protein